MTHTMAKQQQVSIQNFQGINQVIDNCIGNDDYSYIYDCKNVKINRVNDLERDKTPELVGLSGDTPTGSYTGHWQGLLRNVEFEIIGVGQCLYKKFGTELTLIYSGFSGEYPLDFAIYQDTLIIVNGVDVPVYYDGTTCAAITFYDPNNIWEDARPDWVIVYANQIFYLIRNSKKVLKPQPSTYHNFDNTNGTVDGFIIDSGLGDQLTGAALFQGNRFAIFLERSVEEITGSQPSQSSIVDPFSVRNISRQLGCIAPKTIVNIGTDVYFLSERGLESLQAVELGGKVQQTHLFELFEDDYRKYKDDNTIKNAISCYSDLENKIFLYIPYNNVSIQYGFNISSFSADKYEHSISVKTVCCIKNIIYLGDSTGNLYKIDSLIFVSESWVELHWFAGKYGLNVLKKWDKLVLEVETLTPLQNLKIQKRHKKYETQNNTYTEDTEGVSGADLWDVALWDVSKWDKAGYGLITIKNLGKSKAIKLRFYNNTNGEHFKIKRLEMLYTPIGSVK